MKKQFYHLAAIIVLSALNLHAQAQWQLGGNANTGGAYIGTNTQGDPFPIYTSGAEAMRIDANGNVGIGTPNPANIFHIDGNTAGTGSVFRTQAPDNVTQAWRMLYGTGAGTEVFNINNVNGSANVSLGTVQAGHLNFFTYNTQKMTIIGSSGSDDGYVGIGITAPRNLMHLNAGSSAVYTQFTNTTTGNSSATSGFRIGIDANGNAILFNKDADSLNGNMNFYTDSIQRMTIYGLTGYVGIGTAAPKEKLEVNGNILTRGKMLVADDTQTYDLLALILQLQNEVAALKQELANDKKLTDRNSFSDEKFLH